MAQFDLPALSYVCEITDDGIVLAGVELQLPTNGVSLPPDRRLFWAAGGMGPLVAYEQAALQAIQFLHGVYGFVIRDYNFHCVVAYRNLVASAISIAASAV